MNILVSRCFLGKNCTYKGDNNYNQKVIDYISNHNYYDVCPEADGGMTTPRKPSEIKDGTGIDVINNKYIVLSIDGIDVTKYFLNGASIALNVAKKHNCEIAILKANSPSCSSKKIYDGTHKGVLKVGQGVTTSLLELNGIKVIDEYDV